MTNISHNGSLTALREQLAELEHEQWCEWSKALAQTETLSPERLQAWRGRWVPFAELSEADKDLDRDYADRVLSLLLKAGLSADEAAREGGR